MKNSEKVEWWEAIARTTRANRLLYCDPAHLLEFTAHVRALEARVVKLEAALGEVDSALYHDQQGFGLSHEKLRATIRAALEGRGE